MSRYAQQIKASFKEIIDDKETYPSFIDVEVNDNFSIFTIKTIVDTKSELNMQKGFSSLIFIMSGLMYQAFNGGEEVKIMITVNYVKDETGTILRTATSEDLKAE